jgi:hypothetical protein
MLRRKIDEPFLQACRVGDVLFVKSLKRKDVGFDLIHLGMKEVCLNKHRAVAEMLMGLGAWDLEPGLEGACLGGDLKLVKMMIQDGATKWTEGYACALIKGHHDVAQLFDPPDSEKANSWLSKFCLHFGGGCNPWLFNRSGPKQGDFPVVDFSMCLKNLCEASAYDCVKDFLKRKNLVIDSEHLKAACGSGNVKLVELLIEQVPNLDLQDGITKAAEMQHLGMIQYLLERGAVPKKDAVLAAVQTGNYAISQLLCSKLYSKNPVMDVFAQSAIWQMRRMGKKLPPAGQMVDDLYEVGAHACKGGNASIIKMLLEEYQVSKDCLNFEAICSSGSMDAIQYMVELGLADWPRGFCGATKARNVPLAKFISKKIEDECHQEPPLEQLLDLAIMVCDMDLVEQLMTKTGISCGGSEYLLTAIASGYSRMIHFIRERCNGQLPSAQVELLLFTRIRHQYDSSLFLIQNGWPMERNYHIQGCDRPNGSMFMMLQANGIELSTQLLAKHELQNRYPYAWKNFTANLKAILESATKQLINKSLPDNVLSKILRLSNYHDLPEHYAEMINVSKQNFPEEIIQGRY